MSTNVQCFQGSRSHPSCTRHPGLEFLVLHGDFCQLFTYNTWTIIVQLNLCLNHYNFIMTIYSYLFSRGFLSIWPHICRYRRPRPSGDQLLCILAQYISCDRRQSGGNTWHAIMYHIVNGKVGHLIFLSYMSVIISISRSWTSFILLSSICGIAILTV